MPLMDKRNISKLKTMLPDFKCPGSIFEAHSYMNFQMPVPDDGTYMLTAFSLFQSQGMSCTNLEERAQYTFAFINVLNEWKLSLMSSINDFFSGVYVVSVENEVERIVEVPDKANEELENKNKELHRRIRQIEKKAAHEQSENIREIVKLKAELEGLKEILSMHEEANDINEEMETVEDKPSFEEMIAYLNQYKCVIVGGHDHWIKQMQDYFPKWCYYDTASPSQLLQGRQACDAMIFYTKHIGHPLFYKFMNLCKSKNIPHCVLNHANMEKVVQQIYLMARKKIVKK